MTNIPTIPARESMTRCYTNVAIGNAMLAESKVTWVSGEELWNDPNILHGTMRCGTWDANGTWILADQRDAYVRITLDTSGIDTFVLWSRLADLFEMGGLRFE